MMKMTQKFKSRFKLVEKTVWVACRTERIIGSAIEIFRLTPTLDHVTDEAAGVQLLLLEVLVVIDAVRVTGPPHVAPHHNVPEVGF